MQLPPSHIPHSALRPLSQSRPRSALTLAEVLISMGILVVGLLGVASLFPVGGHYMQSGDIADRAGSIAQAALDDAIVRGHLNPENWVAIDIDEVAFGGGANAMEFYKLPQSLRELPKNFGSGPHLSRSTPTSFSDIVYGGAYVIDPLGMAAALEQPEIQSWKILSASGVGSVDSQAARRFPATDGLTYNASKWFPWNTGNQSWPVRRLTTTIDPDRITTANPFTHPLQSPAAQKLFTTSDDLALIMPDNGDDPTRGRWQTWSNGSTSPQAASRQSRGDYSWIISVSPGSSEARDALAKRPDAFQYDVSAVVFYKRDIGVGYQGALEAERLVTAKIVSTGTSGGELLLERRPLSDDSVSQTPFEDLRTGEYVLLTGPHPLSTTNQPILFMQWYRVLTIEDSGQPKLDGTTARQQLNRESRVLVSLRGPDWPWRPTGDLSDNNDLSNDLRLTIIPGAVAVHSKTMRLEAGSAWSGE